MSFSRHVDGVLCPGCEERLEQAHPILKSFYRAVKDKYPDMHTSWVHRDEKSQDDAYSKGASKLKWPNSKHNKLPAEAMDIFQIDSNGLAIFDPKFCHEVKKFAASKGFNLRWGGDFKSLGDYGHFETV